MIYFFSEQVPDLKNKTVIRKWLNQVIMDYGKTTGDINFVFCTDDYLLEMNQKYLDHDYYTDVITFPLDGKQDEVHGEVYVSYDRVRENAKTLRTSLYNELHRVMVHGVLHLLGETDENEISQRRMREKENYYLKDLNVPRGT